MQTNFLKKQTSQVQCQLFYNERTSSSKGATSPTGQERNRHHSTIQTVLLGLHAVLALYDYEVHIALTFALILGDSVFRRMVA